jgi:TolB-like protein/class 3 adenylate cyclase/tetratricopeptide (TPR) repeat protein
MGVRSLEPGCYVSRERVERRLAAVLAADVAGYSRLMGRDEERTLANLKSLRRTLVDPAVAAHRGRIVKTTGDGMLVEFASAVDAARCGVEVQRGMAAQNADIPQDVRIEFRIGIHVGDIIIDDNDIFGDGVNIAARLEGIAETGGVCISDDTHRQIRGKVDVAFEDMGSQNLKNIAEPMRAWRLQIDQTSASPSTAPIVPTMKKAQPLAIPDKPSIAVLPFQNMSGDPEQEYFADGLVEDIITALSRFKSLFVIARNSSFSYKSKSPDVREVGRELGVRYVLEGSVRKSANRVRITGQLVDSLSGTHLWADHFDGTLEDVFVLQDRVTETVVNAIAPRVEQAEIERSKSKSTDRLDAYDYYLRGIARLNLIMAAQPESVLAGAREARALFLKATELDPDFARAYGSAAQCCLIESQHLGATADRATIVAETVRLSRRAVVLGKDDALALSHAGQALAYVAGEIDEGTVLVERAVALNPNLAMAWNFGGWVKIFRGEPEQAIGRFARAIRLNPLDPLVFLPQLGTACGHLFSDNDKEAAVWAEKAIQERPRVIIGLRLAAACFALGGRLDEARKAATLLRELAPNFRIGQVRTLFPLRRPEDLAKYSEGLRLAGLPE